MFNLRCVSRRQFRTLVAAFALRTVAPASAAAQEYPFTLLFRPGGPRCTIDRSRTIGTVYHGTGGQPVFLVYNGEKLPGQTSWPRFQICRDRPPAPNMLYSHAKRKPQIAPSTAAYAVPTSTSTNVRDALKPG